jgi:hypothetical protein
MIRSTLAAVLICACSIFLNTACNTDKKLVVPVYDAYRFDTSVIARLPIYDSLANAITARLPVFHKILDKEEGYLAYQYMPASTEDWVHRQLPAEAGTDIGRWYNQIDSNFIYGFDVFRDSSIKIYIRTTKAESGLVDIEEHLAFFPPGSKIPKREFPMKDTVLNERWQYWTRFNKQDIF